MCRGKWKPQKKIEEAEERLHHHAIVDTVYKSRLGLGNYRGFRGFPSKSLQYLLHQLGMTASETRKAVK